MAIRNITIRFGQFRKIEFDIPDPANWNLVPMLRSIEQSTSGAIRITPSDVFPTLRNLLNGLDKAYSWHYVQGSCPTLSSTKIEKTAEQVSRGQYSISVPFGSLSLSMDFKITPGPYFYMPCSGGSGWLKCRRFIAQYIFTIGISATIPSAATVSITDREFRPPHEEYLVSTPCCRGIEEPVAFKFPQESDSYFVDPRIISAVKRQSSETKKAKGKKVKGKKASR